MSTIKQLIQLHLAGVSNRQIAKQLGIYKNTVNKYIRTLSLDPLSCQDLLTLDDPVLERRLHAGSPAYCQDRFDDLKTLLPYIESELTNWNLPASQQPFSLITRQRSCLSILQETPSVM